MPKTSFRAQALAKAVGTSDVSICTPATSTKAEVRYIKVTNTDAAVTYYLCVSTGTNVAANRVIDQIPIPANTEYERHVFWPLAAAEILCIGSGTADKLTVTVSGHLYTVG